MNHHVHSTNLNKVHILPNVVLVRHSLEKLINMGQRTKPARPLRPRSLSAKPKSVARTNGKAMKPHQWCNNEEKEGDLCIKHMYPTKRVAVAPKNANRARKIENAVRCTVIDERRESELRHDDITAQTMNDSPQPHSPSVDEVSNQTANHWCMSDL